MKIIYVFVAFLSMQIQAKEPQHNLSVCGIFKNESKYLTEWIEYHCLVGVDHFYLYNNSSSDTFNSSLKKYLDQGIVTLIDWPDHLKDGKAESHPISWVLSSQTPAYENAIEVYGNETKWLIFLDVNEFIVPVEEGSLEKILTKHQDCSGLTITSLCFNAAIGNTFPIAELVSENVIKTGFPPISYKEVYKAIVKPEDCYMFTWPPYKCELREGKKSVEMDEAVICINRYINRNKSCIYSLKHRVRGEMLMSKSDKQELLDLGYEFEDQERPILKFIPKLKKKMGLTCLDF